MLCASTIDILCKSLTWLDELYLEDVCFLVGFECPVLLNGGVCLSNMIVIIFIHYQNNEVSVNILWQEVIFVL